MRFSLPPVQFRTGRALLRPGGQSSPGQGSEKSLGGRPSRGLPRGCQPRSQGASPSGAWHRPHPVRAHRKGAKGSSHFHPQNAQENGSASCQSRPLSPPRRRAAHSLIRPGAGNPLAEPARLVKEVPAKSPQLTFRRECEELSPCRRRFFSRLGNEK